MSALWLLTILGSGLTAEYAPGDRNEVLATRYVAEGQSLLAERHFEHALSAFRQAYAERPAAPILFEMGECAMALGRFDQAAGYFGDYLRHAPDEQSRKDAVMKLAEAERQLAMRSVMTPMNLPGPAMTPGTPFYRARWFWSTVAGTAVLSATVMAALHFRQDVEHRPPSGTLGTVDRR